MAYRIDFEEERGLLRVVQSGGDNASTDAIDAMTRVRRDPRFGATCRVLVDLRDGSATRTMLEVDVLSGMVRTIFRGKALAYVAPEDMRTQLHYAADIVNEDHPLTRMAIFGNLAEAEAWLSRTG